MADPQSLESGLSSETAPVAWEVLDHRTVDQLLLREGAAGVIGTLVNETPTPAARADALVDFAVAGNIPKLAEPKSNSRQSRVGGNPSNPRSQTINHAKLDCFPQSNGPSKNGSIFSSLSRGQWPMRYRCGIQNRPTF